MATKEELLASMDFYGVQLQEDAIEKCYDLCISNNLEAQEFVEVFVAFTVNRLNGAEATLSSIDDFERKDLAEYMHEKANPKKSDHPKDFEDYGNVSDDDDDVMGAYVCTTPKAKRGRVQSIHTPAQNAALGSPFSGTIDSPISSTTKDVSGKAVYTFGNAALMKSISWANSRKHAVKIERVPHSTNDTKNDGDSSKFLNPNQDYMYDTLMQRCTTAADRIFDIGQEICTKLIKDQPNEYNEELYSNLSHVDVPSQTTIRCIGRICSDNDCALDKHSTLLIGADEMRLRSVRLNFNRMKAYSVFPGQTVLVQGSNPRGETFFVDKIFAEKSLSFADAPKVSENLSVVVASGPFTSADDLNYEPLKDLLAYCNQNKPDVLILLGPFLDADHSQVQDFSLKMGMETFFEGLISLIVDRVGADTEVLIVSSSQDVLSSVVYPTHPYVFKGKHRCVTCLPDPCIVKLNGVTFGLTSTDIFNHISEAEVSEGVPDKVKRVANYLFHQGSFYPLNPSSDRVSIDSGLAQKYAALPIVPNVLVLTSSAKCFIRDVNNCLVLNAGQLVGGASNETFGRLVVTPTDDTKALANFVGCQIVKT